MVLSNFRKLCQVVCLVVVGACGGEPMVPCEAAAWQWVALHDHPEEAAVAIDAVSVTTQDGAEHFAIETLEWGDGSSASRVGIEAVLGPPDADCTHPEPTFASFPEDATAFITAFPDNGEPWELVTVYVADCAGDGRYGVELLLGDGDAQRHLLDANARGTSHFAVSACTDKSPDLVVSY